MIAVLLAVVALVGAGIVLAVVGYNKLQRARQALQEAWAQIDAQLQRRYDLIGALNAVVAGAAGHEATTLPAVADGRDAMGERDRVEREVSARGRQAVAVAERYPQLRSGERFQQLHEQLVRTEDDIAASRRYYNGRVRQHNDTVQSFPWSLLAGPLGFRPAAYFQVDLDETQAPRVA